MLGGSDVKSQTGTQPYRLNRAATPLEIGHERLAQLYPGKFDHDGREDAVLTVGLSFQA